MQGKLTRASGFSDQLIYINSKSQKPMTLGRGLGGIPHPPTPPPPSQDRQRTPKEYGFFGVLIGEMQ